MNRRKTVLYSDYHLFKKKLRFNDYLHKFVQPKP